MPLDTLENISAQLASIDKKLKEIKDNQPREYMSPAQVADYLGLSLRTVAGDLRKALPWKQVGRRLIVSRAAVDAWAQKTNADTTAGLLDSADKIRDAVRIRGKKRGN